MNEPFDPLSEPAPPVSWWVHWRPAIIAAIVFVASVGGIGYARVQSGATTTTTTTSTTTTVPAIACPECFSLTRIIKRGMQGDDVKRLQQRLKNLRFDPGPIDGRYGGDTMMAVWAFQSLVMQMKRETLVDFVTPATWDIMRAPVTIAPRRQPGSPRHVEIYLPEQVMTVYKGSELLLVTHISSGTGQEWCEEVTIDPGEIGNKGKEPIKIGMCGQAITPGGIYYFYSRKYGTRESKLGTMWNPVYFNFGVAIHGAMEVPPYPASHGCVRIPIFISEYFPAMVKYNDRVYVFDGVKEPEEYGSQPPPWDKLDPNYTTTTSSTTSTVPKTTVPKTTVPKTTVVTPTVTSVP